MKQIFFNFYQFPNCGYAATYSAVQTNGTAIPNFMELAPDRGYFTVYTKKPEYASEYVIEITITYENYKYVGDYLNRERDGMYEECFDDTTTPDDDADYTYCIQDPDRLPDDFVSQQSFRLTVNITSPELKYVIPAIPDAYLFPKPMDLHISRDDPVCNDYPANAKSDEIVTQHNGQELVCIEEGELKSYSYSFGAIMNRDKDEAYLDVEWGELEPYMGWNPVTNTFSIDATYVNKLSAKPHRIKITIREDIEVL